MNQHIDPSAQIHESCELGHGVVIERGVQIGAGCRIGHMAVIYEGTELGPNCTVGAGAVLGKAPQAAATSVNRTVGDLPPLVIGESTIIGTHAVIYRGTTIGQNCLIADLSFVREKTQISDFVVIGAHVTIENRVRIGAYTKIQTGAYITAATTLGDHVFIAPCVITTNDNFMGRTEERFKHWGGPTIDRGARVGAGVTILPNTVIGEESFIAAASLVTRDVLPRTLVMGTPAKARRGVPEAEMVGFKEPAE
jgi:UDP-3-O-[3-hydroxymyristoyl] glucosamine N-acyltransferase